MDLVEHTAALGLEGAVRRSRWPTGIGGRGEQLAAIALQIVADNQVAFEQEHLFPVIMDERYR